MSDSEKRALLSKPKKNDCVLVIHGGAGTMSKEGSSKEQQSLYKAALRSALVAGYEVLNDGGEAMDAAVAAVSIMEDCPLFNASKGAVFNVEGKNELEASIMLSKSPASHPALPGSRRGLGLTLLTRVRNPSKLVRSLYCTPGLAPHTFLSGHTAEELAKSLGEELVDPSYFFTEKRWKEHRRGLGLPEEPVPYPADPEEDSTSRFDNLPTGTVGAVALDTRGCIAAITSTGGRTNKLAGRIGDTPSMGSGFWAEEWKIEGWVKKSWNKVLGRPAKQAVGVSGTGDGDYFIRLSTASTIARRMRYLHENVKVASKNVVENLRNNGGIGGVIALDRRGDVAMPLNCSGMYRGVIRKDGVPRVAIFDDEPLE